MIGHAAGPWEHVALALAGGFIGYKIGSFNVSTAAWAALNNYSKPIPPSAWTPSPNSPAMDVVPTAPQDTSAGAYHISCALLALNTLIAF